MKTVLMLAVAIPALAQMSTEGKVLVGLRVGMAVVDYKVTTRGFENRPHTGFESNPAIANSNGSFNSTKFVAINAVVTTGFAAYDKWLKPKLPPWARWCVRIPAYAGMAFQGTMIVRGVKKGDK